MDYFDLYKARVSKLGADTSDNRIMNMKEKIDYNFKNDGSYRLAIVNFDENNTLDCRFSEDNHDLFKKYFLFKPEDTHKVKEGLYLKIDEGLFLLSEINMSTIEKKGEAYICNNVLRAKGLPDVPCFANNTTYGVKGLKDNNYFKESDKRLRIKIQANNITLKYYEGQRFLFNSNSDFTSEEEIRNEWVCYKVTSKDFTVLKNQYVLELTKDTIKPSLDDLVNGIAFNEKLKNNSEKDEVLADKSKDTDNQEEETNVEPDIFTVEKCKVGEKIKIKINPEDAELKTDEYGKLILINKGEYEFIGVLAGDYATLQLIKNEKILKEKYILIY